MKKTFIYNSLAAAMLVAFNAQAADSENLETLDEIKVDGGSMYRMGEVPVYQAKSAVAITREDMERQDILKADELGRYQAGFANQIYGSDTNTNWFRVRGAEVSQALNGLPTFSYGFFTPHVDMFGLEAVEVTKGADAMTFGAAQAGGLINYVSKRAHKEQVGKGEVKLNVGNKTQYGVAADYTAGLNQDNSARLRSVISYGARDGDWQDTKNEALYIGESFEWDISDRTKLSLLASYQRDHGVPSSNFLPQYGTLVATPRGYIERDSNLGDPRNDTETNRQYSLGYELSHDFGNGFKINSRYSYTHADNFHRGAYPFPYMDPQTYALARGVIYNDGKMINHTTDNYVSWDYKNDWLKNTLVVGTDYRHSKVDAMYDSMGFGATTGTNGFNPREGWNQAQNPNPTHRTIKARQWGIYLQDQARIAEKYVFGFGVRHDRARQNEYTSSQTVKNNHTSYSGSFMYEGAYGINPYFSYSESFYLPVGISGNERLYDPQITRQYELGVKYLPNWLDGVITVAGFRAKDTGALRMNETGVTTQDDPVYRKGLEIQADVNLTPNWNLGLAYTYTKSQTKTPATGEKIRRPSIPTNQVALRTNYNFTDGALKGLTLGAGLRYMGHSVTSLGSTYSHARVPTATVVDLMARYTFNTNWTAQLNIDNVGNRRYIASCDYYCYYGQERKINASLSYKW